MSIPGTSASEMGHFKWHTHASEVVVSPGGMQVSPTTLFLIEGCGQLGQALNWGDGYITDATLIAISDITDPNPFFTTLLGKPYLNNVVIAPHFYPPSVSSATSR